MIRNAALRLLALLLTTLLLSGFFGDRNIGYGVWFIGWGLVTVLLGNFFVALWGTDRRDRNYPSGGDLS